MSTKEPRLELQIDVFSLKQQRALVLPTLTSAELVLAIIQEFGGRQLHDVNADNGQKKQAPALEKLLKIEYLSDNPNDYQLLRTKTQQPIDAAIPIGEQLFPKERLMLVEQELPLPEGTARPTRLAYLRDQSTGKVFKLHWQPAIIGRPDQNLPDNNRLAVNLGTYTTGTRVSRRHAQIGQVGAQFYIERLSPNPTAIRDAQGKTIQIREKQHLLRHGDTIILEGSGIALEFIVREQEPVV